MAETKFKHNSDGQLEIESSSLESIPEPLNHADTQNSASALGFVQLKQNLKQLVESRPPPRRITKLDLAYEHEATPENDLLISWVNNNPHISW